MSDLAARLRHPSQDVLYGLIAAGLILGSVIVRKSMAGDVVAPNILCDEFIYAGIARGLAEGDGYAYRGYHLGFSWVYPLLIAPGWFARTVHTSYEFAKGMNAAVMSLAGVPAYSGRAGSRRRRGPWSRRSSSCSSRPLCSTG